MTRPQALATVLVETDRTRVTRFDFSPGAETGWHVHGHDYVITAITACHMLLEEPGGDSRTVTVQPGEAYARAKAVSHNVINAGTELMTFVEVELL
ncbi:cupin domain-containing protein [Antarctobacter jejuensis]|uniref:cupin domain-containing protein n=1 Tax=Antarctobacter jejuensis TaxID=1439938 RepID=UPI003FD0A9A2